MLTRILTAASLVFACAGAHAESTAATTLGLADATQAIAAAKLYARTHNAPGGAIAVVDSSGTLLALERLDGTFAASANISIGKARTAALFRQRTRVFEEAINNGRTAMTALPADFTPLIGGVPISIGGQVVGAIGVSGAASAQQDEELALAGAAAVAGAAEPLLSAAPIKRFDARAVTAAFAEGKPLLENSVYKVHASRRTEGGQVEVHDDETDIIYVVDGGATLVTGGTPVDGKVTGRGQYRAARLEGGTSQQVARGDVLVIPAGVPHWFKEVQGPFLYFTVKPIAYAGDLP
jgi:glc operon protein GlcG